MLEDVYRRTRRGKRGGRTCRSRSPTPYRVHQEQRIDMPVLDSILLSIASYDTSAAGHHFRSPSRASSSSDAIGHDNSSRTKVPVHDSTASSIVPHGTSRAVDLHPHSGSSKPSSVAPYVILKRTIITRIRSYKKFKLWRGKGKFVKEFVQNNQTLAIESSASSTDSGPDGKVGG